MLDFILTPDVSLLNQIRAELGLPTYRSIASVLQGTPILVNSVYGFEYARHFSPFVHFIGPLVHPASNLSSEVRQAGKTDHGQTAARPRVQDEDVDAWISEAKRSLCAECHAAAPAESCAECPQSAAAWVVAQKAMGRPVVAVALGSVGLVEPGVLDALAFGLRDYAVLWIVSQERNVRAVSAPLELRSVLAHVRSVPRLPKDDLIRAYLRYCHEGGDTQSVLHDSSLCSKQYEVESSDGTMHAGGRSSTGAPEPSEVALASFVHVRTSSIGFDQLLQDIDVVVSHCSLASSQEAILALTSLVCLPLFADQRDTAVRVVDAGAGVVLDRSAVQARDIQKAVQVLRSSFEPVVLPRLLRLARLLTGAGGAEMGAAIIEEVANPSSTRLLLTKEMLWPGVRTKMLDLVVLGVAVVTLGCSIVLALVRVCTVCNSEPASPL